MTILYIKDTFNKIIKFKKQKTLDSYHFLNILNE
jgi:hypothetical protein